jgi:putative DNA primase/helicase
MPYTRPAPGEPPNLTTALKYARRGIRIFPCSAQKRPLLDDWLNAASADANQITEWWTDHPDALIGLPTKHLDLLVVDLDKHAPDQNGIAAFDEMIAGHEPLPEHPIIRTPNDGLHHVFRQPSRFKIGNRKIGQGVETRGYRPENDGGYIIGPGSILPDGRSWRPAKGSPLFLASLVRGVAETPAWLAEKLRGEKEEVPKAPATTSALPVTNRQERYAQAALDGIAQEVAATGQGERNNKLNAAAFRMGTMAARSWIGANTITGRLLDASAACGLLADDGERAVNSTIKSGIEAGMKSPHADIPDRQSRDDAKVIELAKLRPIDYGKARKAAAKQLGVSLTILDGAVKEQKKESTEQANFLPHWTIEPWPNPVDGDALLKDLQSHFNRYIVLPEQADVALALWVLHTYVFGCFDITPYLAVTSPTRRCGKTLLMTVLYWICCRGKKNDAMSKAAIYRSVERDRPTLCLDEVSWVVDLKDERQNILCGGFERNGCAEICVGEGADITTQLFSTYCPKAFGLIGKLTATLMDRSIEIQMKRKMGEKVERLRRRDNDDHAKLRSRCLRWAQDNAEALTATVPALPEKLNDRAIDFWEPLLAIAAQAGGNWTQLATEAALVLSDEEKADHEERSIELLRDIKSIFELSGEVEISTKALIAALCADQERRWAAYNKGKPITDRQLAKLLKPFIIISETVHEYVAGVRSGAKGYKLEKFRDAFERYLPPPKPGPEVSSPENSPSQGCQRASADGSRTTCDFPEGARSDWHPCENGELAYCPSDWNAGTDSKENGGEGHSGEIVANGYAISHSPEDRREPEPGQLFARVWIKQGRPVPLGPPGDYSLDDFIA